ncbi:MAG: cytochrome c biogenesis protein CcsA [Desulfobacula sp.]|jgi:cytochrome c-type biogenesis protein CcsB|uniref:cytochrome c biogenesis protein CcsA n=1 Tax=Desulfobacula sp. TaxID=2593537 RepID=UPI001DD92980|nr:cytochrome c biogenesis protein CcsA [Desulfobacula sp.]MBT3485028.1 cytochrome c biogenesis protein CcsA [Desulfobacula sp.]MBT3804155.1 cytochrome c biogenesis protein CcsA [Desulfobacula sp.]MBT4025011.1 cytochrome c biogenesis protein CcsA [Desulfobacula sp.]MBT4198679.1 cytochrome c biogenesis protein CcsA [Desulfobacula sp.]
MNLQTADIILKITTMLYFTSMAGYLLFLFKQKSIYQRTAFYLITTAVAFHLVSMIIYTMSTRSVPIQNLSQSLSVAAFFLGSMFLFFQYRFDLKILGVFASVLLFVIMLAVLIIPDAPVENNAILKGFWFYAHIILVFTGEAALALACGAGILYLLQEKGIKTKSPGFFFKRLPSLDLLDNVGYTCLATGFALLTIGLVTGFIYAKTIWGRFWSWDTKEVFSVGSWLVYAALLHLRLYSGWRGRKSAIMTIIGFLIIIFVFLGVNMLLGGHHQDFTK